MKFRPCIDIHGGCVKQIVGGTLVDGKGAEAIPCRYQLVSSFVDGFARVCLDGKFGVIDKKGAEALPCVYDLVCNIYEGGYVIVSSGEKCGLYKLGSAAATAPAGVGVLVDGVRFHDEAPESAGSAVFTMTGGVISDNTAIFGGGVSVGYSGTFTMSGGTITGNAAEEDA